MSTTINKAGADVWFKPANHIKASVWSSFDTNMQTAAIAMAIRDISISIGSSIESETVDSDDYYYPDRACYEQALYILENSDGISNGEKSGPKFLAQRDESAVRERQLRIGPEARRWIRWGYGATMSISRSS